MDNPGADTIKSFQTPQAIIDTALKFIGNGFSVLPLKQQRDSSPLYSWKHLQSRILTPAEVRRDFKDKTGIAVIGGKISGGGAIDEDLRDHGLIIVDFDRPDMLQAWYDRCCQRGLGEVALFVMNGYMEKTHKGAHIMWRSPVFEGARKLARDIDGNVLIETREESSYAIVAPTYGDVHKYGGIYVVYRGVHGGEEVKVLTADLTESLLDVCRSFDKYRKNAEIREAPTKNAIHANATGKTVVGDNWGGGGEDDSVKPGAIFCDRGAWDKLLEAHNWTHQFTNSDGVEHWARPGKERGISATVGYCEDGRGNPALYVFSTNAAPLEGGEVYNKFAALAHLEYGGDYSATSRALNDAGFRDPTEQDRRPERYTDFSNIETILRQYSMVDEPVEPDVTNLGIDVDIETPVSGKNGVGSNGTMLSLVEGVSSEQSSGSSEQSTGSSEQSSVPVWGVEGSDYKPTEFPQWVYDQAHVGLLGEILDWIGDNARIKRPVLTLASALSINGALFSRRFRNQTGLSTNLYITSVGKTACGKEHGRSCGRALFDAVAPKTGEIGGGEDIASGSALTKMLMAHPVKWTPIDEIWKLFQKINQVNINDHVAEIKTIMLSTYETQGIMKGKEKAIEDRHDCFDPCLNIYGTTTDIMFDYLSSRDAIDGLLSRFLFFIESPEVVYADRTKGSLPPVPESILRKVARIHPTPMLNNQVCKPFVVKDTIEADRVFAQLERDKHDESFGIEAVRVRMDSQAMKLALGRACAEGRRNISGEDATWAAEVVKCTSRGLGRVLIEKAGENEQERNVKKVLGIIKRLCQGSGSREFGKNEITRKTQHLNGRDRSDILATLCDSGQLKKLPVPKLGNKGGVKERFRLLV